MVSYCQTEGVNSFLVVETSAAATCSYEADMLYNNFIDGLIQPEFRALDGDVMIYYKINSMVSLDLYSRNTDMPRKQLSCLFMSVLGAASEVTEYMLNADSLVLDMDKIFCCGDGERYQMVYAVGYEKDVRKQIRQLAEELMRRISHRDRAAADFLYGLYEQLTIPSYDIGGVAEYIRRCDIKAEPRMGWNEDPEKAAANARLLNEVFGDKPDIPAQTLQSVHGKDAEPVKEGMHAGICIAAMAVTALLGLGIVIYQCIVFGKVDDVRPIMLVAALLAALMLVYLEIKKNEVAHQDLIQNEKLPERVACVEQPLVCSEPCVRPVHTCEETQLLCDTRDKTSLLTREDSGTFLETTIELESGGEMLRIIMDRAEKIIGRDMGSSDVYVDGRGVSRRHARLSVSGRDVFVEDMESTNGTFVNGIRLPHKRKWRLVDGDELQIGDVHYHIKYSGGEQPQTL